MRTKQSNRNLFFFYYFFFELRLMSIRIVLEMVSCNTHLMDNVTKSKSLKLMYTVVMQYFCYLISHLTASQWFYLSLMFKSQIYPNFYLQHNLSYFQRIHSKNQELNLRSSPHQKFRTHSVIIFNVMSENINFDTNVIVNLHTLITPYGFTFTLCSM